MDAQPIVERTELTWAEIPLVDRHAEIRAGAGGMANSLLPAQTIESTGASAT
jgi:hypothetical protein